jgi:NAD(P)H-dependent FMN reductase
MSSNTLLKILIIIGSTRQNRFSEKAASWIFHEAKQIPDIEAEMLDLRDYPMPFYDEPVSPSMFAKTNHQYTNEVINKWLQKIDEADGYIMVTPEYNHGYPAVLKNAIDFGYKEWHKKPVGFVSYGSALGARVIEQLRQVVIELHMVPIRNSIHIPPAIVMSVKSADNPNTLELFNPIKDGPIHKVEVFFADLVWATKMLKNARL